MYTSLWTTFQIYCQQIIHTILANVIQVTIYEQLFQTTVFNVQHVLSFSGC